MKHGNKKIFNFLSFLEFFFLLAALVCAAALVKTRLDIWRQRRQEERLIQTAFGEAGEPVEPPEASEPPSPVDFAALKAANPDTVGWLRIPGTRIDYPVVQTTDNEIYLHTDFNGNPDRYGTVFLDCDSSADFSGRNNLIYGHHMRDGSMFKEVAKFKDREYFMAHRYFELYTPGRTIHLKAVACYDSDSNGIMRETEFASQAAFDDWVRERLSPCAFAAFPEAPVKSVFVLVTCSYRQDDARTLLFAVETDGGAECAKMN